MRWMGWCVALAAGCQVGGRDAEWTFEGATGLTIELGSGDVRVQSSGTDLASVGYAGGGVGKAARPDIYQDASGEVVVDARTLLGGGDIGATVPDGIPVTVILDRGDVSVELDAPASVDACVGAGHVQFCVPPGSYDMQFELGSGSIAENVVDDPNAEHTLHACAGAGAIDVFVQHPGDDDFID